MARRSLNTTTTLIVIAGACLSATVAGCSSPTRPGVSVAPAQPVSPANATQVPYYSQPVTLVIANGVATGGASPTTSVEIATDSAFTAVVTRQTVSPDANGQLTVKLDHLTPSTTYYWHARTAAGDNPGVFSPPASFTVGPQLVIQPPAPVQPLAGSFQHKRPTFVVTNATRTGPEASLTYRFEVATDATFGTVVASGTVPEGSTQTVFTPIVDLVSGARYAWRAQASDTAKGVTSEYSAAQFFTTVNPDDGTFPYVLHVRAPSSCALRLGPDYEMDPAPLMVSGDTLRLSANLPDRLSGGGIQITMTRIGNRLSGTIDGVFAIRLVWQWGLRVGATRADPTYFESSPVGSASLSGVAADDGTLNGTFDGYVQETNFVSEAHSCSASGFAWTLTPR